jgi:hypothetical protein
MGGNGGCHQPAYPLLQESIVQTYGRRDRHEYPHVLPWLAALGALHLQLTANNVVPIRQLSQLTRLDTGQRRIHQADLLRSRADC